MKRFYNIEINILILFFKFMKNVVSIEKFAKLRRCLRLIKEFWEKSEGLKLKTAAN